jgi:hypothetical protein
MFSVCSSSEAAVFQSGWTYCGTWEGEGFLDVTPGDGRTKSLDLALMSRGYETMV